MGTDFLQRVGKTLKRSWDHGRITIAERDLFSRELLSSGRGVTAEVVQGVTLTKGDTVTAEVEGGKLVFRRGLTVVACNENPTPAVTSLIRDAHNVRPAIVNVVHAMAGIAEIEIKC